MEFTSSDLISDYLDYRPRYLYKPSSTVRCGNLKPLRTKASKFIAWQTVYSPADVRPGFCYVQPFQNSISLYIKTSTPEKMLEEFCLNPSNNFSCSSLADYIQFDADLPSLLVVDLLSFRFSSHH